jgi:hypothetical protein
MRIRTAFVLAVAALAIGVPGAAADPDGYQPQLQAGAPPDAFDRYLGNHAPDEQSDAFSRYLGNHTSSTGAAGHPDSRPDRWTPIGEAEPLSAGGREWTIGALGALGGAILMFLAASIRGRRRLVLR